MFTLFEPSEEFSNLRQSLQELSTALIEQIDCPSTALSYSAEQEVPEHDYCESMVFVETGVARVERSSQVICFHEAGDCIGWGERMLSNVRIFADANLSARQFPREAFFKAVRADSQLDTTWNTILEHREALFLDVLQHLDSDDSLFIPERRYVGEGDPIVIQDTSPTEVFILLKGSANVYVGDVVVGKVLEGEIFGAMAATTNTTRSASVIADSECVVAVIPQDSFLSLVRTHPQTVHRLIKSMSRIIVAQNEKLVAVEDGGIQ